VSVVLKEPHPNEIDRRCVMNDKREKQTAENERRSGWNVAMEVIGWLIIMLSGSCSGVYFLVILLGSKSYLTYDAIILIGGIPMAFGCLLVYLSWRKWK